MSKKIFGIINKRGEVQISIAGCGAWKKIHKLTRGGDVYLALKSKGFYKKFSFIKSIPESSFFVTMDVSSVYTMINHQESGEFCIYS